MLQEKLNFEFKDFIKETETPEGVSYL